MFMTRHVNLHNLERSKTANTVLYLSYNRVELAGEATASSRIISKQYCAHIQEGHSQEARNEMRLCLHSALQADQRPASSTKTAPLLLGEVAPANHAFQTAKLTRPRNSLVAHGKHSPAKGVRRIRVHVVVAVAAGAPRAAATSARRWGPAPAATSAASTPLRLCLRLPSPRALLCAEVKRRRRRGSDAGSIQSAIWTAAWRQL